MIKTIYKYVLYKQISTFEIPKHANFLCVLVDPLSEEYPALYFEVMNVDVKEERTFCGFYTGVDVNGEFYSKEKYMGSVANKNGIAIHVYEKVIK